MIFPKGIEKGCTIGIIAPSSPFTKYALESIKEKLESLDYKVKLGESCYKSYKGYLAGEDEIRARDIENMFLNKSIDGILCIRGGYGTPRILDLIDYNIIKENPKFFIGYSDITALHTAFIQKANLITFHGIMGGSCLEWDEFTYKSLIDAVNMEKSLTISNPTGVNIETMVDGIAQGMLVGGNLSLLAATMGTEYEIETKGKILFIEDVGERIYSIDRMLTQLALGRKFDDCEGIILGDFSDCKKEHDDDFDLEELLKDRISKYNKPCIYNLKSGHCMPMISLPLGVNCKLDATNQVIQLFK